VNRLQAAGLFDGSMRPGVYRLVAPLPQITEALQAAGWSWIALDPVSDRAGFYREFAERMGVGDFFGANLDALWDCLTDLEQPTALVLSEWTRFAGQQPEQWARIFEVLTERIGVAPPFALVLA
jgi:RNAse (barnase) inhibitor barstar